MKKETSKIPHVLHSVRNSATFYHRLLTGLWCSQHHSYYELW